MQRCPMHSKFIKRVPSHLWVTASAWLGRSIIALSQIICIPLLLQVLGAERYAVFAVSMSLLGWCALADFGLGYSLQNYISGRRAEGNSYDDLIVTTSAILLPLGMTLMFVLFISANFLGPMLYPTSGLSQNEYVEIFRLSTSLFVITILGTISYRIFYAEQRGYWANIIPALASLIGLLGLLLLKHSLIHVSIWWAFLVFNGPLAAMAAGTLLKLVIVSLLRGGKWSGRYAIDLLQRGASFWLFALLAAFVLQIDYLIIARLLTPQDVVNYNIVTKVLGFIAFFYVAVIQALWPLCSEAASRKKWLEVDLHFFRAIITGGIIILFGGGMLWFFKQTIFNLLSPNHTVDITLELYLSLILYYLIRVWCDSYAMLLQSMSKMRIFFIFVPIQAVLSLLGQTYLAPTMGLQGIVFGLIIAFSFTVMWALPFEYSRIKKS